MQKKYRPVKTPKRAPIIKKEKAHDFVVDWNSLEVSRLPLQVGKFTRHAAKGFPNFTPKGFSF